MKRRDNIAAINELSASERVFTTAQAERLGVSRDALAKACVSGRLDRIAHGAYRMAGVPPTEYDELIALWKLTKPALYRMHRVLARRRASLGGGRGYVVFKAIPIPTGTSETGVLAYRVQRATRRGALPLESGLLLMNSLDEAFCLFGQEPSRPSLHNAIPALECFCCHELP